MAGTINSGIVRYHLATSALSVFRAKIATILVCCIIDSLLLAIVQL